jgi:Flagellar hook-length control protein FliK
MTSAVSSLAQAAVAPPAQHAAGLKEGPRLSFTRALDKLADAGRQKEAAQDAAPQKDGARAAADVFAALIEGALPPQPAALALGSPIAVSEAPVPTSMPTALPKTEPRSSEPVAVPVEDALAGAGGVAARLVGERRFLPAAASPLPSGSVTIPMASASASPWNSAAAPPTEAFAAPNNSAEAATKSSAQTAPLGARTFAPAASAASGIGPTLPPAGRASGAPKDPSSHPRSSSSARAPGFRAGGREVVGPSADAPTRPHDAPEKAARENPAVRGADGPAGVAAANPDATPSAGSPDASLMVAGASPANLAAEAGAPAARAAPVADRAPAASPAAGPVREIDLNLSPAGLEDVSMTMRLAGDRINVVIRAASSQTASAIESARDVIAERLAAIGQPLGALVIQQTGATDGNATANGSGTSEGDGGRPGQGERSDVGDPRGSRRGASRD